MRGSPFWQAAFVFVGVVFLVWQTWRGWRAGLFRGGVNFAAILVSTVLGCLAAELTAAPFGGLHSLSGLLAGAVVGGGLGIFLFVAIWFVGAVTLKRTGHHAFGPLRFLWGAGGALFGFLIGLAVLLGSISVVRGLGALAESRIEATQRDAREPLPTRVAGGLVMLRESLELGSTGRFLESVDVLPVGFYEIVLQVGKLTSDQEKMARFLEYPGIRETLQNPRVVAALCDPGVVRAWQDRNVLRIINSKAVAAAVKDPALAEQLKNVDVRAALKFALESPPPSQSPSSSLPPKKRK